MEPLEIEEHISHTRVTGAQNAATQQVLQSKDEDRHADRRNVRWKCLHKLRARRHANTHTHTPSELSFVQEAAIFVPVEYITIPLQLKIQDLKADRRLDPALLVDRDHYCRLPRGNHTRGPVRQAPSSWWPGQKAPRYGMGSKYHGMRRCSSMRPKANFISKMTIQAARQPHRSVLIVAVGMRVP